MPLSYDRIEERLGSPHKAVIGTYRLTIRSEDSALRSQLTEAYLFPA
jgi:hypothetical protein